MSSSSKRAMAAHTVATLHIFKYDASVVPLQQGIVWQVNGVFNLAYLINLELFQNIVEETEKEAAVIVDPRVEALPSII